MNRVEQIVAQVLGIAVSDIHDDSGPHVSPSWDSVAQLDIVLSLEAEFSVRLSTQEMLEMVSVGAMKRVLRARGVPA